MKLKNILTGALVLASVLPVAAKPRSEAQILEAASSVLVKSNPGMMRSPSKNASLDILETNEAYTVVGFSGGSFAIVSNDDLLPAVLAYSSTPFDESSDNPGFAWWSRSIKKAAAEIVKRAVAVDVTLPDPARFPVAVPQMLSDVWGQMAPFNNLCPLEYDANGNVRGRCVVGCVATSASQVLRYHQYPPKGEGVHIDMQTSDAHGNPRPLKVDFADYDFDWANMLDSYSAGNYTEKQAEAVAKLCYPLGVSFGMIYGTGFSGTYSDSSVVALRKYLKFPNAQRFNRRDKSEKDWMETIYNELSHNRPILYCGADDWGTVGGGGHAFVFDGYNEEGMVHVNWGWYGRFDGYYHVSLLDPGIHGFKNQQDMIIGVAPPEQGDRHIAETFTGTLTADALATLVSRSKTGELHEIDLSSAILPDGVLPDRAFYGSRFRRIVLPSTLKTVGMGVFGNCRELREVVFPEADMSQKFFVEDDIVYSRDGSEVIAVMPYYHNEEPVIAAFTSMLRFRDGVKTICAMAADGCYRVQGVRIPASIERIGGNAFTGCSGLKAVIAEGSAPNGMAARAFGTLDAGFTRLYVPAGTSDRYYRAGEWGKFFAFDNVYEYGTNVVARSHVRQVGEKNPDLTWQIFGDYVTGEPELTCEADENSPAGEYPIHVAMGSLSGKEITLTDGMMRVLNGDDVSVEEILASGIPVDVYSLDGRPVAFGITSLDGLPAGIYVIDGRKVSVR